MKSQQEATDSSTEHKGTPPPPRCTTAPRIIWPWEISLDGQSVLRVPVVQPDIALPSRVFIHLTLQQALEMQGDEAQMS